MEKTVIITGGAGFIGSNLARKLVEMPGNEVIVIDNLKNGKKDNLPAEVEFIQSDIGNEKLDRRLAGLKGAICAVVNLAAQIDVRVSVADPALDAEINIMQTLRLLQLCHSLRVPRFVFASSGGAVYGEPVRIPTSEIDPACPVNPYGAAKLYIEHVLQSMALTAGHEFLPISLRLANVYGPHQDGCGEAGVVAIFCKKFIAGENPIIYGDGRQTRDYVYVGDVVDAILCALDKRTLTGSFNIGTQKETSVNALFAQLVEASGCEAIPEYRPARKGEQMRSCLDCAKAMKELGWEPKFSLREGLMCTYEWFLNGRK